MLKSESQEIKLMNCIKNLSKTGLIWLWITVLVIIIDRVTKYWVVGHLMPFESFTILPIFNLTLAFNTGAAWSFLDKASGWQNMVLGSLAVIVSGVIIHWLSKLSSRSRFVSVALCLIIGGAIGNALDRVIYGYVIDFLDFHLNDWHFAIFNVADSAISIGAFMLILHWFFFGKKLK